MNRAPVLFILCAVLPALAVPLGISGPSRQYPRIDWYPVKLIDNDLLALPVESGIDVLSLPDLSLVDHIDVLWPDDAVMTMNYGKIAYAEKEGGGAALRIYDLKTKENREIKRGENKIYDHPVISSGWIGYRERDSDSWQGRLCMTTTDGSAEVEVKGGESWFADAYKNYFVIWNWGGPIELYDVLKQKVVASKTPRKGWCDGASINGDWMTYVDRTPEDRASHDIWLWNYRTGEEKLVSKGVDGKNGVDRQNCCIVSGDTVVWFKMNDASERRDPAIYSYSIKRNETGLVKKGELNPVDLEGNSLLFWDFDDGEYTLYDLSTGKEVELRKPENVGE